MATAYVPTIAESADDLKISHQFLKPTNENLKLLIGKKTKVRISADENIILDKLEYLETKRRQSNQLN